MKKWLGVIVAILVLAVIGMLGATYWSGAQAERWYEEALVEGSKSGNVKLSTVRYQRGLFSSQAVTRVDVAKPPEGGDSTISDPSFSIRQDIYHGPLPLAGREATGIPVQWAGAVVRATLDLDSSAWTRELAKWYGSQEPVVAILKIAFDGASDTQITMPPLALKDIEEVQSLLFSGLQGQFRVAAHSAAVQGNLTVASLEAVGKSAAASEQIKLKDLTMTINQHKGAFDLLFGESSFKVGELRAQDPATGAPFIVTNLSMTGSLSQQNPQQVAGEVLLKADRMTVDQQSGTGSLRLALHNLDGSTIEQLQQWQQKVSNNPDDPQALNELLKAVKALLHGKPELILDTQANLTQGDWQGQLTLNFQDFEHIDFLQDPSSLLAALEKGSAEVVASKKLVETVLADTIGEELQAQAEGQDQSVSEEALQSMAAIQANQQLQELAAAGFIRLEGDHYKTTARFEGGKLFVNDQEIPLMPPIDGGDHALEGEIPTEPARP
ncbi:MAG: YdgA family protein [Gammaproteobacteria bacterium]|nr:YdgA family protein [Gammaproteobacteria bacterium]MCP5198035.1 YdgA family protein [Gammaproteobacteria bacterium]